GAAPPEPHGPALAAGPDLGPHRRRADLSPCLAAAGHAVVVRAVDGGHRGPGGRPGLGDDGCRGAAAVPGAVLERAECAPAQGVGPVLEWPPAPAAQLPVALPYLGARLRRRAPVQLSPARDAGHADAPAGAAAVVHGTGARLDARAPRHRRLDAAARPVQRRAAADRLADPAARAGAGGLRGRARPLDAWAGTARTP